MSASVGKAIALAALLHDIGKLLQRAGVELCSESKEMEGHLCPLRAGHYSHRHVLWTDHFFRKSLDERLLTEIFGPPTFPDNVATLAAYHHQPDSQWQRVIQEADTLSAKEREGGDTATGGWEKAKRRRLSPVFQSLKLEAEKIEESRFRYNLRPLTLTNSVFPAELSEDNDLTTEYREHLWQPFEQHLCRVQAEVSQTRNKFDLLFNSLYSLLHKYTWCIPSFTQSECDISLFDHLRTTSALALCLYIVQNSQETVEKPLLLVEGDISGIQKFIYRLAAPTGVKHIAGLLRGRSFYLTILPLVLAKHIIWRLDLTIANILWCGGGKFDLLLPNTSKIRQELSKVENEFSDWFFDEFEAALGIVLGSVEAGRQEWEDFGSLLSKLHVHVEEQKNRKFLGKLSGSFGADERLPHKICPVCGLYEAEEGEEVCAKCSLQREIGSHLPKTGYLVFTTVDPGTRTAGYCLNFGRFGAVHFLKEESDLRNFYGLPGVTDVLSINELENFTFGFTLIGKEVATASTDFFTEDGTQVKQDNILPFEVLAEMSEGDERLGVLKMDIDHLGLLFALGLPPEQRSVSRISTLSRMLDWFFCGYIATVAQETFANWRQKTGPVALSDKVRGCIYTIYSGGDDLLIVAPWSQAIDFAHLVHNCFKEFACFNRDVDLSAGLYLCKPKFTVSRASVLANEALSNAKGGGRKRISALGDIVTWQDADGSPGFHELLKLGDWLAGCLRKKGRQEKLPRRFLHSLLGIRTQCLRDGRIDLNYIPLLLYIITRNVPDESLKLKLTQYFICGKDALGYFRNSLIPATIALLKTRKGGGQK